MDASTQLQPLSSAKAVKDMETQVQRAINS